MPVYGKPDLEAFDLLAGVMAEFHRDLVEHEVRIDLLIASPARLNEVVVKFHGHAAPAAVKVNSYRDRVQGFADATITLDSWIWKESTAAQRAAILDRELVRLEIPRDKHNHAKADDIGRPILKRLAYDVVVGWSLAAARRHGADSYEVRQARQIQDEYGQLLFSWAEGPGAASIGAAIARGPLPGQGEMFEPAS